VIFSLAIAFEDHYLDVGADPTRCKRVIRPLRLPDPDQRDQALLSFAGNLTDLGRARGGCTVDRVFSGGTYVEKMRKVEQIPPHSPRIKRLEMMSALVKQYRRDTGRITCSACEKMADAVIAVSILRGWKLHSLDMAHAPVCQAAGHDCQVHLSLAAWRRSLAGAGPVPKA
jgi:hypothetical protein